jgi:hypothetical protein
MDAGWYYKNGGGFMVVSGKWTLHYDWGCGGSYSQVDMNFNNDGTFTLPGGNGNWVQIEGTIIWRFNTGPAIYGGNIVGSSMTGLMSTFGGSNGCWYALKSGATTMLAKERKPELDASGKKATY